MYRTSVDDLKSMNDIKNASSLQAGQVLKVRTSGSEIVSASTVGRTYKVRSGDTMWSVAKANDTSVETLKRLNPKVASAGLKAGSSIKVPSAGSVSVASSSSKKAPTKVAAKAPAKKTNYRNHRVQKGQTLSGIARKYNTSVDTLKRLNGIRDARGVEAGKTLKVPL
jgi:membrane-bound lytic murein transglycosylase D